VGRDRVNCPLYSGWRLGKGKPGIFPDGEGQVEAAGERIEVRGVGLSWGVRIGAREGDGAQVINLRDVAFREEAVGLGEGCSGYVGEGGGYALSKGLGSGSGSGAEETS